MVKIADAQNTLYKEDTVWEVNDRYGQACAVRIKTPEGVDTNFSMVYGKDEESKLWIPVRPVSDRFTPIGTGEIIDKVVDRLGGQSKIYSERVRLGRGGVTQQVELVLDEGAVKIGDTVEDKDSPLIANGVIKKNGDVWRPQVRVRNALDGTQAISVTAGWYRLVCSNGMTVEAWNGATARTIKIHTIHQVVKALDEIEHFDFNVKEFQAMMKKLRAKTITKTELGKIRKSLPKNYQVGFDEIPEQTAYGVISYITYLQSHHLSMNRESRVQGIVDNMLRKVA